MPFPAEQRDDALPVPPAQESTRNTETLLAFNDDAMPHLKRLLGNDKQDSKATGSTAFAASQEFLNEYLQSGRRHKSPWATVGGNSDKKDPVAEKKEDPKPAQKDPVVEKKEDPKPEPKDPVVEKKEDPKPEQKDPVVEKPGTEDRKELPELTLDTTVKVKINKDDTKITELVPDSLLPKFTIDTSKIKDAGDKALDDILNWYNQFAAKAKDLVSASDKPVQPETPAKPAVPAPVESLVGSWKKEGESWNLYDKSGQKLENKYEGKVSEVTKDADGNVQLKLDNGHSVIEKKDGSVLKYDEKNHLSSVTYKDGTSRSFKWEGNELIGMASKTGEWTRARDKEGNLKANEWSKKDPASNWTGEMKVDEKKGELTVGNTTYNSDLSVEKKNADGSREITHANKDLTKIDKNGLVSEISYADGSNRKFHWGKNENAKNEDDKYYLNGVEVKRDGKTYWHSLQQDGKWQVQTQQNGGWTTAKDETLSFDFNRKTGEYTYVDSQDGVRHLRQAGGLEKQITRDGFTLEYKDGALTKASKGEQSREFEWKNNKLVAIHDGIQGKTWTPAEGGGWKSDKGDKQAGEAKVNAGAEISFKDGNKTSVIKMDGAQYNRIENEKEKSVVDISKNSVQVTAGDGSTRQFKTGEDGKEVIQESVTRNNKTESWTRGERLPNGNYNWTNDQDPSKKEERASVTQEDGKLKIDYPDGRKYQANTDGSERLENSKAEWSIDYKNGQPSESKFADGTIRKYKFDAPGTSPKSIEVINKDGSVVNITRESEGVYNYKSKSSEMKWNVKFEVTRDGVYKFNDKDEKGKVTTRFIDGKKIVDDPVNKTVVETFKDEPMKVTKDGKTTQLVRDEKNAISEVRDYASNTSYKKNSSGEWVPSALDSTKPFAKLDNITRKGDPVLDENGNVSFCDRDGRQVRQAAGEKGSIVSSKEKTIEAVLNNPSMSDAEKETLRKNILEYSERADVPPKVKSAFQEHLAKFAERSDISDAEKAKTYKEMNRLLESKSETTFNAKDKGMLAAQLAWHIGNPESNAQGENPNCQVTSIRSRLLYESPSDFARMMTDVITTGQFVTMDKTVIKPPTTSFQIAKNSEESKFPPEDGSRTWMGKISDVTIANTHWQRQTKAPSGEVVSKGHLVYRQDPPGSRKDTGARLYKEPGDGYIYPQNGSDGKLIEQPTLYAKDIAATFRQIVGHNKENVILAVQRTDISGGPGVGLLQNEEQLHNILSKEKGPHIAQIWTGTDWCWREPARKYNFKPKDETDGEHVLIVKDYDPKTRTVAVDNSWSSKYDRTAPDRRISLHDLYKAMAKQN